MSLEKKARATKKDLDKIKSSLRRHIHLPSRISNAIAESNEEIKGMLEEDVDSLARQYYSLYGTHLREKIIHTISNAYRRGHERGIIFNSVVYDASFDIP